MQHPFKNLTMLAIVASALILASCSESETPATSTGSVIGTSDKDVKTMELYEDYVRQHAGMKGERTQGALTYITEICNGTYEGSSTHRAILDPDQWNYYKFYANAGDEISLTVNRTTCAMDPEFTLWLGTSTYTDGLEFTGGTHPDLTRVIRQDDDFVQALGCGPFRDPTVIDYALPTTGWYTLAVYDNWGDAAGPFEYELVVDGLPCDSDGDGIPDDEDDYPNSDTQPYVTMDGCDSGVENQQLDNGAYMMDLILECKENASNHGEFVSCLSALTNEWKAAGLISGSDKGSITSCGGNANWP